MQIRLPLSRVNRVLIAAGAAVMLAGLWAALSGFYGNDSALVDMFSLSDEANFPTWYSSGLLLACSVALGLVAMVEWQAMSRFRRHWVWLSAIFCYMSIDEAVEIHEHLDELPFLPETSGFLTFVWVIPMGVLVLIFAISYLRFLFHLPIRTRVRVALAAALYVGGALGVEMVLANWIDIHGHDNLATRLIDGLQESMEIAGSSLFFATLLDYLAGRGGELGVKLDRPGPRAG